MHTPRTVPEGASRAGDAHLPGVDSGADVRLWTVFGTSASTLCAPRWTLSPALNKAFCMFRTSGRLLALATLTAAFAACNEPMEASDDIRVTSAAIEGGTVDDEHTAVVGIAIINGFQQGGCSGSLIAPNLVLTAQHCVADSPAAIDCRSAEFGEIYGPDSFFVTTATTFPNNPRDWYSVQRVEVVPGARDVCGQDVAVLILDQNIPEAEAVPFVPKIDIAPEQGDRYVASGYGVDADGNGSGTRRQRANRQVYCYGDTCAQLGGGQVADTELVGSAGTCQGDSGGPPIDADGMVFGALSRGGDGCTASIYSGIYGHAEWLMEMGVLAADLGGYTAPTWALTGSTEDLPDGDGDGIPDEIDNCLDVSNTVQDDVDFDGLGDACDSNDDRDRGGTCAVCNACQVDADCARRGVCVDFGDGGVCAYDCGDGACPDTTACFDVPAGGGTRSLCLNDNAGSAGICPDDYVCGTPRADLPADACRVCDVCSSDDDCGSGGVCRDFGSGRVCSQGCDGGCPDGTQCFDVGDESFCLNDDAGSAGVCPLSWVCDGSSSGGGGGNGGGNDGEDDGIIISGSSTSGGCAAADRGNGFGALAALGLVAMIRRRRR